MMTGRTKVSDAPAGFDYMSFNVRKIQLSCLALSRDHIIAEFYDGKNACIILEIIRNRSLTMADGQHESLAD